MALTDLLLGFFRQAPVAEVIPLAREEARKALALDDRLGDAWGVLGTVELYFDWNFDLARQHLERSVALAPHDFLTRHSWADYLLAAGRLEESLDQVKIGRSAEPTSPLANVVVLFHTSYAHRFDEVIAEARRVITAFPKFPMARGLLSEALWRTGRYEQAIAEDRIMLGPDSRLPGLMETELRRAGPRAALRAYADFVLSRAEAGRASPYVVAGAFADAGEADLAFTWLEKAYEERTPQLLHLPGDPAFDPVRDDPRYKDLLRRIGIPMPGS